MDISCASPCTKNEPIPDWVLPPVQGGGGAGTIVTANSLSVQFTGDGSEGNPLTATVQGNVAVEIATSRVAGFGGDEIIFAYSTELGFTLRSNPPSSVAILGSINDFRVNIFKGSDEIGHIDVVSGVQMVTFPADVVFAPNELLIYVSDAPATFDLLAITFVGERELTFV